MDNVISDKSKRALKLPLKEDPKDYETQLDD
jgi:hypothetical protein